MSAPFFDPASGKSCTRSIACACSSSRYRPKYCQLAYARCTTTRPNVAAYSVTGSISTTGSWTLKRDAR